jgi:hypothetical protein
VQGLIVGVGCSGSVNHVLLGHLTLALARRLDALVDFDGLLGVTPSQAATLATRQAWPGREHWRPGRLAEVSYDTGGGGRWLRHVGDVEFLEAWLQHPDFHLTK